MSQLTFKQPSATEPIQVLKQPRPRGWRNTWTNYLYIVPILIFVGGITIGGIVYMFYVSGLDWNGISRTNIKFVGLDQFQKVFTDPVFYTALSNTAIYMALTIPTQMMLGLGLAILVRSNLFLGALYKIIFFVPVIIAPAVVSYVFRHIFDPNLGELNNFFDKVGLSSLSSLTWLADPHLALYVIIFIAIWEGTGFSFTLYLAALTVVDPNYYEAARIDGANSWQLFRHMTVPLLRTSHFSLLILGIISALKTFDIVYLTTGGGPGNATQFLTTYIYKKTILEFNAGYGAALSVVLFLITLLVTIVQLRLYRRQ